MDDPQLKISKYKKRVGIASVILLAVGLLSGVILVQRSQELREKAAVDGVDIFFEPNSLDVDLNTSDNYYDIYLDAKENPAYEVSAIVIEVTYDPQRLLITDILKSTSLPLQLEKEIGTDTAKITLAIGDPENPFTGTDKVATVVFDSLDVSGQAAIDFTQNTQVAAINCTGNMLGTASGGEIMVASTPTSTPTPPVATPTPIVCTEDGDCLELGGECCVGPKFLDRSCPITKARCGPPSHTPRPTPPPTSCVDSDVGEEPDDIYIKGSVTYTDESGAQNVLHDECNGSNTQVNERWCYESPAGSDNYVPGTMVYNCEDGCLDGACITDNLTCVDSDVGEEPDDIYIKGSVTYTDESGAQNVLHDECNGSNTQVNERWCYESPAGSDNYVPGTMVYNCEDGCNDGACITATPTPVCTQTNGDANGDGKATPTDFAIWAYYFDPFYLTSRGPAVGDFNCDGYVSANDFAIWAYYFTPF